MHRRHIFISIVSLTLLFSACAPQPALSEMETWDMVWISDSSGWGVAEVFASMIEEDTGININLHDNWMGGLSAGDVLSALQGNPTPSYTLEKNAEQIREAEVIVFYANPDQSWEEGNPTDWVCITGTHDYVNNCEMDTFGTYVDHLESIYEIIFELRGDQPTIIRAYDAYNPLIAKFKEQGVYEACKECWANYNTAIHQAAASFNIPVAEVALAWNGPDFDQDPVALGYTSDGEHPSELGARVIAQALRDLGYDPIQP